MQALVSMMHLKCLIADASPVGLGVALSQQRVEVYVKSLADVENRNSQTEKQKHWL